jgi:hypothetical protein
MCQTGILFSNHKFADFDFSFDSPPPYKTGLDDDKCIVFVSQGEHQLLLNMQTEECCDKLFTYEKGLSRVRAYSGSQNGKMIIFESMSEPSIFQFISDEKVISTSFGIRIDSLGTQSPHEYIAFFDPLNTTVAVCPDIECHDFDWLTWKLGCILLGSIVGVVFLNSFLFVCTAKLCCRHFVQVPDGVRNPAREAGIDSVAGENRREPIGYFALDPVLRPTEGGGNA